MAQKLQAIKGGGGSIRVGTTGTISALMSRELEPVKSSPEASISSRNKPRTVPVSVPCGASAPKKLTRKSLDEANCSGSRNKMSSGSNETPQKMRSAQRMPILVSENITPDGTPRRGKKTDQKKLNIVEIVDVGCGNADRAWASPIASKLKKLGFSKLSESII